MNKHFQQLNLKINRSTVQAIIDNPKSMVKNVLNISII